MLPEHELICSVRLNDDACLYAGYTDVIRRMCRTENIGALITHPYGLHLAKNSDGVLLARRRNDMNNTVGIAFLSGKSKLNTIYDAGSYIRYHERFPMISSEISNAWIRVLNSTPGRTDSLREGWVPATRLQLEIASRFPHLDLATAMAR
jgi:hypothetical protein